MLPFPGKSYLLDSKIPYDVKHQQRFLISVIFTNICNNSNFQMDRPYVRFLKSAIWMVLYLVTKTQNQMLAQPASTTDPKIWSEDYFGTLGYFILIAFWTKRHVDGTLLSNRNTKLDTDAAIIHHRPPKFCQKTTLAHKNISFLQHFG